MDTKQPVDYQPHRNWRGRKFLYLMTALGVLLGVLFRGPITALLSKGGKPPPRPQLQRPVTSTTQSDVRKRVRERLEPNLAWADFESQRIVGEHLKALDDFFADAKKRTPAFVKDALGYRSKWYLVVDKMPYTRTDRHAQFLKGAFSDDIFSPDQLTQVLNQLVKNYVASVTSIEDQMLVKMRADVSDLPPSALPSFKNEAALRTAFEHALAEAKERAGADLKADISREITSEIVGDVLAWVAVRLGVEGGILAAGAGSSWETLGIGLVVAIIVDQIVSWVWDWWRNPAGELTGKINAKLDEIHNLLVDGDKNALGLRGKLVELSKSRATLRRAAVLHMVGAAQETKP